MSKEIIDFEFSISEYNCSKCSEVFYGYHEKVCPYCGEIATEEGRSLEHLLSIELNRKNRQIYTFEPDSFLR